MGGLFFQILKILNLIVSAKHTMFAGACLEFAEDPLYIDNIPWVPLALPQVSLRHGASFPEAWGKFP